MPELKSTTRDNLIYLSVGLGIVALVVADLIYTEAHGRQMWTPSPFAWRIASGAGLLEYFVVREMCRAKAGLVEGFAAVISAAVVHFMIFFAFRRAVVELSGLTFSAIDVFEIFFVFQLSVQVASAVAKTLNDSKKMSLRR